MTRDERRVVKWFAETLISVYEVQELVFGRLKGFAWMYGFVWIWEHVWVRRFS